MRVTDDPELVVESQGVSSLPDTTGSIHLLVGFNRIKFQERLASCCQYTYSH